MNACSSGGPPALAVSVLPDQLRTAGKVGGIGALCPPRRHAVEQVRDGIERRLQGVAQHQHAVGRGADDCRGAGRAVGGDQQSAGIHGRGAPRGCRAELAACASTP